MKNEEISYKDLSKRQLEAVKDIYINKRVASMSEEDLKIFVRTIIADQIQDTVGNEEEREAWKEMKEFFDDNFEEIIKGVINEKNSLDQEIDADNNELNKRLELIEKRKKEQTNSNEDMW